jgi:hypothetical protein
VGKWKVICKGSPLKSLGYSVAKLVRFTRQIVFGRRRSRSAKALDREAIPKTEVGDGEGKLNDFSDKEREDDDDEESEDEGDKRMRACTLISQAAHSSVPYLCIFAR